MDKPSLSELKAALEGLKTHALDRQKNLSSLPTIATTDPLQGDTLRTLPSNIPKQGWGLTKSTEFLFEQVASILNPGQAGPRYFGFVTGGVLPSALVSDWFTSLYDQNVQVHLPRETASSIIDSYTIQMIIQLLGLQQSRFTGTLTTGATSSNLLALLCAREETIKNCMYRRTGIKDWSVAEYGLSSAALPIKVFVCQAHASIRKTAALAGIGRANVIEMGKKMDSEQCNDPRTAHLACLEFDLDQLERALRKCHDDMTPAIVVLGMGEVVTGALTDQTVDVRRLCDQYDAWLHMDAAFSAFVCLIDGYKWISAHMNMCDSITSDGHKALNVPYDCGIFLVKKDDQLKSPHLSSLDAVCGPGTSKGPSYLATASHPSGEENSFIKSINSIPSPLNRNLENSSRFRALPLYISLLCEGIDGTTALIQRNLDFASTIRAWLEQHPFYQVLTPPCEPLDIEKDRLPQRWKGHWCTTVIFFRAEPTRCPIAAFTDPTNGHLTLISAIKETRKIYVSPGSLNGINGIRIAVSNWSTGLEGDSDLEITKTALLQVMQNN